MEHNANHPAGQSPEKLPEPGRYRHFKGGEYELMYIATNSETEEKMVVYRALYGEGGIWVRPLSMWSEMVNWQGRQVPRFRPIAQIEAEPSALWESDTSEADPAANQPVPPDKHGVLKRYFGYSDFRPGQSEIVDSILSGSDTLAVMPTGAGKSICYQVPAMMLPSITLVISPLISLMKDQVQALIQNGIPAAYLNSTLTERQYALALQNAEQGRYKIIYVAPERLDTPRFLEFARRARIALVAVDEAHCISQWGQDFRQSYLDIPRFIDALNARPVVSAFTATATQQVREDIVRLLALEEPRSFITGFDRNNLYYGVIHASRKDADLLRLLKPYQGLSGIIYCATRKKVESVFETLLKKGWSVTRYHAGLSDEERRANQEDFTYDRRQIMVATNAFGMGIDKSNVRFVIHYNMPKDIESYYQEAGRAGRDGERADCLLLYGQQDILTQKFFIEHMGEEAGLEGEALRTVQEAARRRLDAMIHLCNTDRCLRQTILRYFGEEAPDNCGFCLNCLSPQPREDATQDAQLVLSCVEQLPYRYGRTMIVDLLAGAENDKIRKSRYDTLLCYGALRKRPRVFINAVIDALIEAQGLSEQLIHTATGDFSVLEPGPAAEAVLAGSQTLSVRPIRAGKAAESGKQDTGNYDRDLYARLSALRRKLAQVKGLPPYVVLHDSVLRALSEQQPRTLDEMSKISGIGAKKLKDYGKPFLREICQYLADTDSQRR